MTALSVLAGGLLLGSTMSSAVPGVASVQESVLVAQPPAQTVTPLDFQRAIHRYLAERWDGKVSKITVLVLAPTEGSRLPAGRLSLSVDPIGLVMQPGRALFWVSLSVNGRPVQKQKVAAEIQAYANVALTTRVIQQGEILTGADLRLTEWRLRAIEHGLVVSPDEAVGKRVQLRISEWRPIPRAALESPEVAPAKERTTSGGAAEAGRQSALSNDEPTRPPLPSTGGRFRIR